MTKRLLVLGLSLAALTVFASPSLAHGFRHKCAPAANCGGGCGGCGPVVATCAPVVAPAPVITYVEKEIIVCKPTWVDQKVTCTVMKPYNVTKDVPYTEMVQKVTPTKQLQKYCETVMVDQPCEYTVMDRQVTKQKQKVTTYNVSYKTVTEMVPYCRRVKVPCCDPCTGCCRCVWTKVTEMVPRCRTICERTPVTSEVIVDVVTCVPRVVKSTTKVCKLVEKTREVTVNVVSCTPVQKVRKVNYIECRPEAVTQIVKVCKMVQTKEKIKVPVCTANCGGCCDAGCGHTGHRFHLFHRHACCG